MIDFILFYLMMVFLNHSNIDDDNEWIEANDIEDILQTWIWNLAFNS
jgi:hypothetical protein